VSRASCAEIKRRILSGGMTSLRGVGFTSRRPCRPKLQARSAVCEEHASSSALPNKGGSAARVGADGASPSRRSMGAATPMCTFGAWIVPLGRVGSPQRTQTTGAKRRLLGVDGVGNRFANSNTLLNKGSFAANIGPRRRGDPTIPFRWALPPHSLRGSAPMKTLSELACGVSGLTDFYKRKKLEG